MGARGNGLAPKWRPAKQLHNPRVGGAWFSGSSLELNVRTHGRRWEEKKKNHKSAAGEWRQSEGKEAESEATAET